MPWILIASPWHAPGILFGNQKQVAKLRSFVIIGEGIGRKVTCDSMKCKEILNSYGI